ncbi:MAG: hypothetical protein H0X38_12060, partial [Planctomycetes bacterium]|nr:hypothetical protein [Planctomycetota bacterium]
MCGVAAYLGTGQAVPVLLGALARQAERGEDSAGLAMPLAGSLAVRRTVGRCP